MIQIQLLQLQLLKLQKLQHTTPDEDEEDAEETPTPESESVSFLGALGRLGTKNQLDSETKTADSVNVGSTNRSGNLDSGNWLGRLYYNDEAPGESLDTDGDGYTDLLELDYQTDPGNASSYPPEPLTNLERRFDNIDDDLDGLIKW